MESNCWNCGASAPERFCADCKALQPPPADYFVFFGLPAQLSLDGKELEKQFYALSRQLHPDIFARKSQREREYSLEATAVLNDGFRVLRDPIQRAMYVLKKQGLDIGEQGTRDVPPELLEEVFDLNMALEEMKFGDEEARTQILGARERFEGMCKEIDGELKKLFAAWDAGHDAEVLTEIRGLLNRRKYITNLIKQTETA